MNKQGDHLLLSVTELAQVLEMTQGNMSKRLKDLEPDLLEGNAKFYRLVRVLAHINGNDLDPTYERARLSKEQADKLALENAVSRGELAPLEFFESTVTRYTRQVAAMLDAVPNRLRQMLPHLTPLDFARIEGLLTNERQRLADRLASGEEENPGGDSTRGADTAQT